MAATLKLEAKTVKERKPSRIRKWLRHQNPLVLLLVPFAINFVTGWFFYWRGAKSTENKRQEVKQEEKQEAKQDRERNFQSLGFADLAAGRRTGASTYVELTVFLFRDPTFANLHVQLDGAVIDKVGDDNLTKNFDTEGGSPQKLAIHLLNIKAHSEITTCLTIDDRTSTGSGPILRVVQTFSPSFFTSKNVSDVVEFHQTFISDVLHIAQKDISSCIKPGNDSTHRQ